MSDYAKNMWKAIAAIVTVSCGAGCFILSVLGAVWMIGKKEQ